MEWPVQAKNGKEILSGIDRYFACGGLFKEASGSIHWPVIPVGQEAKDYWSHQEERSDEFDTVCDVDAEILKRSYYRR
jgi:hypothetical protein